MQYRAKYPKIETDTKQLNEVMKIKEEFQSLAERDREMELCVIVPHQQLKEIVRVVA